MKSKAIEYLLVTVQVITIAYLVLFTSWNELPLWAYFLTAAAGFLAFWAIFTMQLVQLRVTPTPADHARLITHGPYRIIRHPMYTSLLLLAAPLVIAEFSMIRLIAALIMAADLWFKMNYEERLLLEKFPGYKEYIHTSKRVLPYIY